MYDQNCASCHGPTGAGDGPVGPRVSLAGRLPRPEYRFRQPLVNMNNGSADIPFQGLSEREAATRLKVDELPQADRRSLG